MNLRSRFRRGRHSLTLMNCISRVRRVGSDSEGENDSIWEYAEGGRQKSQFMADKVNTADKS